MWCTADHFHVDAIELGGLRTLTRPDHATELGCRVVPEVSLLSVVRRASRLEVQSEPESLLFEQ